MTKKSKKSNQKLGLKLKHYSALAASVVALDATSQVIYTDVKDTTLVNNGDYFDIDLNNDGIREGRIELIQTTSTFSTFYGSQTIVTKAAEVDSLVSASVNVLTSTLTIGTSTTSTYVAAALNLNSNINNNLNNWSTGTSTSTYTSTTSTAFNGVLLGGKASFGSQSTLSVGQFPGAGDKFLGVKFTIGTSTHFGWVRLDMSANSDSITIKDYAYESTANATILAGDTGTTVGLTKNELKNKLDFYTTNGKININSELGSNSTLSIYDLSGKLIQTSIIGLQKEVSVKGNLQGIYIVEIRDSKSVTRKKLWLESN
ncbi:MAG: T9SS type A sorting domain-containing protein [Vicingaceae bacterium]